MSNPKNIPVSFVPRRVFKLATFLTYRLSRSWSNLIKLGWCTIKLLDDASRISNYFQMGKYLFNFAFEVAVSLHNLQQSHISLFTEQPNKARLYFITRQLTKHNVFCCTILHSFQRNKLTTFNSTCSLNHILLLCSI